MLREVIGTSSISEIYKLGSADVKRGALVTKNLTTKVADKASDVGVDVWLVDFDSQPTGHLADVEVSQYDVDMDTVKAGTYALLKKYPIGASFATDQIDGTFAVGDYAVAGTTTKTSLFIKATTGKVSALKFIGDYVDGDKTLKQFEVVNPVTV